MDKIDVNKHQVKFKAKQQVEATKYQFAKKVSTLEEDSFGQYITYQ